MTDNVYLDVASYCLAMCTLDGMLEGRLPSLYSENADIRGWKTVFKDSVRIANHQYSDGPLGFSMPVMFCDLPGIKSDDIRAEFCHIRYYGLRYADNGFPSWDAMHAYQEELRLRTVRYNEAEAREREDAEKKRKAEYEAWQAKMKAEQEEREARAKAAREEREKEEAEIQALKDAAKAELNKSRNLPLKDRWTPAVDALIRDGRVPSGDIGRMLNCSSSAVGARRHKLKLMDEQAAAEAVVSVNDEVGCGNGND